MKTLMDFLKSTVTGGFFIVLPLLLLFVLLGEIVEAVIGLAEPIAELFPKEWFDEESEQVAWAFILLLSASVFLGLLTRLAIVRQFVDWLERNTVGRLPLYQAVKSLSSRFAAIDGDGKFKPALILGSDDRREFVYLMEDLGDGFAVVMIPYTPTPMAGAIKLVPMSQVEILDVSLGELTAVISHWGLGSKALMDKSR